MNTRSYVMRERQRAKEATRDAILASAIDAVMAERSFAITLPTVAERAEVTVKTILRHFGSRDGLIDTALERAYDEVLAERSPPTHAPADALRVLIVHYERRGDMVLAALAQENDPRAMRLTSAGRIAHRAWVDEVFAQRLPAEEAARTRLVDALVVATDVYCWKLLRRDRGLSVDEVLDRMLLMTEALTGTS
ncbi:TetR/AcrR family transcriptional regulator [Mycobacterium sp. SMC-4]|uniref:TetR/AcrR family transcriptional regulator n=1 Tax=Mycobacterium sp. SMC-4 TaxID=2857059 RepID=UPI0021B4BB32|nr:TetR/AcrR family transcriptional regulator [Mycobacterium sp. SMC-4]UXA18900.1 TetR/AcrR family transcriptional regulator [Mycobacterium sp. SMC-4]